MRFRAERYQIALIFLGVIALGMFFVFLIRELFPEYRIYQNTYIALEKFRSSYTHEPPAPFEVGIKQIVINPENKGPPIIDRCISCHVALKDPHYSPTAIAYDKEGNIRRDEQGIPLKKENPDYIWSKLDQKINDLRDPKVIAQLRESGESRLVEERLTQADALEELRTAHVGEHIYDMTKVLVAHPLIGKETRPFEFHSQDEYGCVSCHNGNGRGLTTEKAHGPIFDGTYEIEYMGPHPVFNEKDFENDPDFSRQFNSKPGPKLLFQTTPLYIGSLMEAKCVQCHQPSLKVINNNEKEVAFTDQNSDASIFSSSANVVDNLTKHYQQGRELYFSQACYACHRIAGLSRGGVGLDLTQIGNSYPWYIKESIIWPQADLKTSTMPNYRMDHEEVEDLMTFLLAQKGNTQVLSSEAYKVAVQAWETGRKQEWEKPVNPAQITDLRYSMTVFATEGCAACHRLLGYESNVGYTIQKDRDIADDFDALYQEHQWFQKLIPENIIGSQLVQIIEKNQEEFDKRISDNVRENSIIEEIEKKYPGQIEAFYTPFKFAARAKNSHYLKLIASENDPDKQAMLKEELEQWKERVRRILMIYIQEYGLGRLVCPKPSWSGIFRSDQWLMEHFRSPSLTVPNSIMPVFPFDDTKFYALTYMLDALGVRNRDAVREIWKRKGFDPELAFHIHCAQCHGESRNGLGPVAEWLYPLPKNLRNAEFLRNLTKERALQSIVHGVIGTPMPPWGVVEKDKPNDEIPILTINEAQQLVDWLFSNLAGEESFGKPKEVPKWQYEPEDVLRELEKEGNPLQLENGSKNPQSSVLSETAYVSLNSNVLDSRELKVSDLFDIAPNPVPGGVDERGYYIKKSFYTKENIEKGKLFFELNCAPCHGKEADGSGMRAEVMQDAKPRMLTNLNWINTRDDMRLLRSIKYGVPGTSMTPWGDLTSSLQRIQLVTFIRSLTENHQMRNAFLQALYKSFDANQFHITEAYADEYQSHNTIRKEYEEARAKRIEIYRAVESGNASAEQALKIYQKELELLSKLQKVEKDEQLVSKLRQLVEKEKLLFRDMGTSLLAYNPSEELMSDFIQLTALRDRWFLKKNELNLFTSEEEENQSSILKNKIIDFLNEGIVKTESEINAIETQPSSYSQKDRISSLKQHLATTKSLREQLISQMDKADEIRKQEIEIFKQRMQK